MFINRSLFFGKYLFYFHKIIGLAYMNINIITENNVVKHILFQRSTICI